MEQRQTSPGILEISIYLIFIIGLEVFIVIGIFVALVKAKESIMINFNKILGVHESALLLRAKRSEVLAGNIANADTPNYLARDLDFKEILKKQSVSNVSLQASHKNHIALDAGIATEGMLKYRWPLQNSADGNTVDTQKEVAKFTENSMRFQASFHFLNNKFLGIKKALKGE